MARPTSVVTPMTETDGASRRELGTATPTPVQPQQAVPELAPVIRSKIQPPALRSTTLSRQRLLDRLRDSSKCRVTQVVAEAGYGKTTLLADFAAHSDLRTFWYRLDPTDADPITWANYLVAAAREQAPDFGRATTALLAQVSTAGPPNSVIVASVIDELHDLGDVPSMLVLDDFHAVDGSAEARAFVEQLARDAPKWLHLVISSRRKPPLQLARLEALGELATVETDDLRFSLPETEQLFADVYGAALEPDVLRDVDRRARGWAASLQLFHGSIRGKSSAAVRALAHALSGATSPVYDFLAEEVMSNVSDEIDELVVRASILDRVTAGYVVALFSDGNHSVAMSTAREWMDEADRLGLLSRTSQTSEARHLHPLLRDFLDQRLRQRMYEEQIKQLHLQVARTVESSEPLVATRHYLEAGYEREAMAALGSSVMLTMGSGQWGVASGLIDRLKGVPADPAVAAILARKLIEEGDLSGAAQLLHGIDVSSSPPDVRAVFRHAKLSLGWRTGDRDLMFATLAEIQSDTETPRILGDIFEVFRDASPIAPLPVPYATLAYRLERMAREQELSGHSYYSAISLHNSALMHMAAGRFRDAKEQASRALGAFDNVPGASDERFSTHAVLSVCAFELADQQEGEEQARLALSSGRERGDVHAECAYTLVTIGDRYRASQLLLTADEQQLQGRSDVTGEINATFARALAALSSDAGGALALLEEVPKALPLDTGYDLDRQVLTALAHLLLGESEVALHLASTAQVLARAKGARRCDARLGLIIALASSDADRLREALGIAESTSELAILAVADALGHHLQLVPEVPEPLRRSIRLWPKRWLPILRRRLDAGATPNAAVAAKLLDEYGELADVGRLRAFAKAYKRRLRRSASVGRSLARRVAPHLQIHDLGRSELLVGQRSVLVGSMRRKSAALIMYLVTRAGQTATREQALDELWPDSDPESASNNLNQSLYFLRRDIDPWYEDDMSVEYVGFQSDVLWLDSALTDITSARFVADVRAALSDRIPPTEAATLVGRYVGQFSPEFEYEEWAITWRTRIHALYLQFAAQTIDGLVGQLELDLARDVSLQVLVQDSSASDIERKLAWIYWHTGARSAAVAQLEHLAAQERSDGLDPTSISEISGSSLPE